LYGLLGGALIALVVAVFFYFSANSAKQTAILEKNSADAAKIKSDSALNNFLAAKLAKDELEFNALESRANIILSSGGCPASIVRNMDSLIKTYSNSNIEVKQDWKNKLAFVTEKSKNCK
jgi:hypothetical protein